MIRVDRREKNYSQLTRKQKLRRIDELTTSDFNEIISQSQDVPENTHHLLEPRTIMMHDDSNTSDVFNNSNVSNEFHNIDNDNENLIYTAAAVSVFEDSLDSFDSDNGQNFVMNDSIEDDFDLREALQDWAVGKNIAHASVDELLVLQRHAGHTELPAS